MTTSARRPFRRVIVPPIDRLKLSGRLSTWEMNAADEIVYAYRAFVDATGGGAKDLRLPAYHRPDAADSVAVRRVDLLRTLYRWRKDLRGSYAAVAGTSILLNELSPHRTEREYRWRNGSAIRHLRVALRHFAFLTGNTPTGAHDWCYRRPRGRPVAVRKVDTTSAC